jgi:hypothetical protein
MTRKSISLFRTTKFDPASGAALRSNPNRLVSRVTPFLAEVTGLIPLRAVITGVRAEQSRAYAIARRSLKGRQPARLFPSCLRHARSVLLSSTSQFLSLRASSLPFRGRRRDTWIKASSFCPGLGTDAVSTYCQ